MVSLGPAPAGQRRCWAPRGGCGEEPKPAGRDRAGPGRVGSGRVRPGRAGQSKALRTGPEDGKPRFPGPGCRVHRDVVLSDAPCLDHTPGTSTRLATRRRDAARPERAREATRGCGCIDAHSHTLQSAYLRLLLCNDVNTVPHICFKFSVLSGLLARGDDLTGGVCKTGGH